LKDPAIIILLRLSSSKYANSNSFDDCEGFAKSKVG
jgi:hypothetical protein